MKRISFVFAMLVTTACGGKKESAPEPVAGSAQPAGSGSATGSAAGSAAAGSADAGSAGSAAVAAEVDVPTEVDFEAESTARITEKNVDTELKVIEKELAQ
jgi:hypothetical protein